MKTLKSKYLSVMLLKDIKFRKEYHLQSSSGYTIDIKKVDKQLTHAMHVKDRHVNDTFID